MQNLARRPWPDERLDGLYRKAAGLQAAGNLQQAFAGYSEILRTSFPGHIINRPDAYIQAAYDVGAIFQASNQNPQGAVYHFGRALFLRAFDPNYHMAFAQALMTEGCPWRRAHAFRAGSALGVGDGKRLPAGPAGRHPQT